MEKTQNTSRLLQDLLDLEKDFKYNLMLLEIRESEIKRCNAAIRKLEENTQIDVGTVSELKSKISVLETKLCKLEEERTYEKQIHQRAMGQLMENFNEMTRKHQKCVEECERKIKQRQIEMERLKTTALNEKDNFHQREINAVKEQLIAEKTKITKTKAQLNNLIDENLQLRTKLRELESQHTTESSIYENELKTVNANNANLKFEIEYLRSCDNELQKAMDQKTTLQKQLQEKNNKITETTQRNVDLSNELHRQTIECTKLKKQLQISEEECRRAKTHLQTELEQLRNILEANQFCNVQKHDTIQKQNDMFQEIIKTLRNERSYYSEQAEKRIQQLESSLRMLKKHIIEK